MKTYINYFISAFGIFMVLISCQPNVKEGTEKKQSKSEPIPKGSFKALEYKIPFIASYRGIYAVDNNVIWASGSNNTVVKSEDGGESWRQRKLGITSIKDFRDIHAWDKDNAIVLSAGDSSVILRTNDGGNSWTTVYSDNREEIFFDGFDFNNKGKGMAFSDPLDGKLYVIESLDKGYTWNELDSLPSVLEGEAGFAASGSGIIVSDHETFIGTGGGNTPRLLIYQDKTWEYRPAPMIGGSASGIFSIAVGKNDNLVAVGGSYIDSTKAEGHIAYTVNRGKTWLLPKNPPNGFRSSVVYVKKNDIFVACGRTGIDYSIDVSNWKSLPLKKTYYTMSATENAVFLAGRNGRFAYIKF